MRIGYKVSWLAIDTALLATAILGVVSYFNAKRQFIDGIDRQLTAAAVAVPGVIGEDYLAAANDPASTGNVDPARYAERVRSLSRAADTAGVFYMYAFARRGDAIVHLATSASAAERADQSWAAYLEPYQQPPDNLLATFADGTTRFAEYDDEFGSFRSIFVRQVDGAGRPYVVGVDASLESINAELRKLIVRYLLTGVGVAAVAGALGILLARRLAKPIVQLTSEVEAWSKRDFATDDTTRASLAQIGETQKDETGELARRFVALQNRLQTYLKELTEATAARQTMEHQLEIAKSIQEGLLPDKMPAVENFQIVGWSKPADQTGGDYFDWTELPDGKVVLTIGDVTGHGIGPALVTAASRAYARATFNTTEALEKTVARLNELLHADLQGDRFVTLIACMLDPKARTLKLVAAGHGPILIYRKATNAVEVSQDTHGVPLGAFGGCDYDPPTDITFAPGDTLVLVSDGFYDWMDAAGEVFGTERLCDSVRRACSSDVPNVIEAIREDIARFNGGRLQHDDTTAVVIRCTA